MRKRMQKKVGEYLYVTGKVSRHKDYPHVQRAMIKDIDDPSNVYYIDGDEKLSMLPSGTYRMTLTDVRGTMAKIAYFTPCNAALPVVFKEFAADEGEVPRSKASPNDPYDRKFFYAALKVVSGEWEGLEVRCRFIDLFDVGVDEETGDEVVLVKYLEDKTKQNTTTHGKRLDDFLYYGGALDRGFLPAKYIDNPLPMFQKAMLHAKKTFTMTTNSGGWPEDFYAKDVSDDTDDFEIPETAWGEDTTPEPEFSDPDVASSVDLESDDAWAED